MDQVASDRLLMELGQMILADANYVDRDWVGIAVVFQHDPRTRQFGYVYDADGKWEAETPSSFDALRKAGELRTSMAGDDGAMWKSCLVQIKRPGPKLVTDFDWDDGARWAISPANLAARVEELRP